MPLSMHCMINAPKTEPMMVPLPPANAVPPMTVAAMTSNSRLLPSELVPALRREMATIAAMVISTANRMKSSMVTRRTGIPTSAAASGLPPMAKI